MYYLLTVLGPELEKLMEQLRSDLGASPPLPGSYSPKKGDLCAAKFIDGEWYRARVEKVTGHQVNIIYVDYGNVSWLFKFFRIVNVFFWINLNMNLFL